MVTLRPLKSDDVPRIAELERELFGVGAWSEALIKEEVNGYGRWYVVAEIADIADASKTELIGYAGIWDDGDVAQVMTLGVAPQYHRQGIGRALLEALIDESIKRDLAEMFLEVAVDNEPALTLYRSYGFAPLAIRKRYYQPGNKDAYTMRLQLR
jgi:[ribosomal protein S18]-alanine N-acetyltransferase